MSNIINHNLEAEGIFVGKPTKEAVINYFMKQQRLVTLRKLEESDRDTSPELSESFEMYLEQKKKKIEKEKNRILYETSNELQIDPDLNEYQSSKTNNSFNDESFLQLEKMCENTLNINNVSEILADLTSLEINPNSIEKIKNNAEDETHLFDIEQPSLFEDSSLVFFNEKSPTKKCSEFRPSTIMELTERSLSFKSTQSGLQAKHSITSTDKSTCYITANDKSFDSLLLNNDTLFLDKKDMEENIDNNISFPTESNVFKKDFNIEDHKINDTLDEIEFLLLEAEKVNYNEKIKKDNLEASKKIKEKENINVVKQKPATPGKCNFKGNLVNTSKQSPLITFSPTIVKNSPSSFKCPKLPSSSAKPSQYTKINSKKFQHIVSPISRYIQTSESVLNANAHVQYKGSTARRHFNFRDSENFDETFDSTIKTSSLPLRAKTNQTEIGSQMATKFKNEKRDNQFKVFINNTLNDSEVNN